jgi:hypothetical protein
MSKRSSKSKRRSKALPALGVAGVSLSMASGACASTTEASANTPPTPQSQSHEIFLGEEEIYDVSLSTFYDAAPRPFVGSAGGRKMGRFLGAVKRCALGLMPMPQSTTPHCGEHPARRARCADNEIVAGLGAGVWSRDANRCYRFGAGITSPVLTTPPSTVRAS